MNLKCLIVVSLLFAFAQIATAQSTDVAGPWLVTWTKYDTCKPNAITLVDQGSGFAGSYLEDSGQLCPITAGVVEDGGLVGFTVTCAGYRPIMAGALMPDGTVEGEYSSASSTGDVNSSNTGPFKMARRN